jgi:aspartate carbamoyltransferase catalytic subunit
MLGAGVHLIAPPTLMPAGAESWGADIFHDMRAGLKDCDVVMMLRLQSERMAGGFIPSPREYFWFYGLDAEKLSHARPGALVMHPGPMNRGIEIDSIVADDGDISLIERQVKMGVALRMAVLEALALTGASPGAPA